MPERISVAIVGGGPAGLTCAIYLCRAGIDCHLFEPAVPGGMVFMIHQIENYPGFPEGINGRELSAKMEAQARRFGAKIVQMSVNKVEREAEGFKITLDNGEEFLARAVVIATGSKPKRLGIKGEAELFARGVSYCATCDGNFFRNQDVAVIGGGDSALQEALYLSHLCKKVYIVHRRDKFRAKKILEDRVRQEQNIQLVLNALPQEVLADKNNMVQGLLVKDKETGKESLLNVEGVFFYVGMEPSSSMVSDLVKLDEQGFIIAGEDTRTNIPGIFAIGDVRTKRARQVASAVADGCNASFAIEEFFLD